MLKKEEKPNWFTLKKVEECWNDWVEPQLDNWSSIVAVTIRTIMFFILFLTILLVHHNCNYFLPIAETEKNLPIHDAFSFLLGTLAIGIGWHISKKIDKSTMNEFEELKRAEKEIEQSTREIKESTKKLEYASSQRVVESINDIFSTLIEMLKNTRDNNADKFYVMNEPSSFGKIHSYNKRLLRSFHGKPNNSSISDYEILAFIEKTRRVKHLIYECADKVSDFKMLVTFDIEQFVKDYFLAENSEDDITKEDGLVYYEQEGQNIKNKNEATSTNKTEIETSIKDSFNRFNQEVIDSCNSTKPSSIKTTNKKIQYQIYLSDGIKGKISFMLFYFDEVAQ